MSTPQESGPPAGSPVAVLDAPQPAVDPALTAAPGTAGAMVHVPQTAVREMVAPTPHPVIVFDEGRRKILADTIMPGANESELEFFQLVCKRTGLDPFARQIHAVKRRVKNGNRYEDRWSFQVAIDGFRLIAERTGKYAGQTVPLFCGDDGVWREVWLSAEPPRACKVGVLRRDFDRPLYAVALWDEYVQLVDEWEEGQKTGGKRPAAMWAKMPTAMLAKVTEALALRKAFPQEMSGLYTDDEMAQADNNAQGAEQRQAGVTHAGDHAAGGVQGKAPEPAADWTGDGPTYTIAPYKGVPLNAIWNTGAIKVKKGKGGAPDTSAEVGGQFVIADRRLTEAVKWARGKVEAHYSAERAGESKGLLKEQDVEFLIGMLDEMQGEIERRAALLDDAAQAAARADLSAAEGEPTAQQGQTVDGAAVAP